MFVESVNLVYDCVAAMQVLSGHVSQMGHKIARAGTAGTIKLLLRERTGKEPVRLTAWVDLDRFPASLESEAGERTP